MFIEIEQDCLNVEHRKFEGRDGKPDRHTWKQKAYMHVTGSKYPKEIFIPLQSEQPMQIGTYELHDSTYQVDQYGGLKLNAFEQQWLMVKDSKGKALGSQ